jgi:hypothetical protein
MVGPDDSVSQQDHRVHPEPSAGDDESLRESEGANFFDLDARRQRPTVHGRAMQRSQINRESPGGFGRRVEQEMLGEQHDHHDHDQDTEPTLDDAHARHLASSFIDVAQTALRERQRRRRHPDTSGQLEALEHSTGGAAMRVYPCGCSPASAVDVRPPTVAHG